MPRIFADADALKEERTTLTGEWHHYLVRVLRMGAGDRVCLFDGRGVEVEGTIERVGPRDVTLGLGARTFVAIPPVAPVTLLQGLPRADRMDLIVQKATELGAGRLIPVRTARTAAGQRGRLDRWTRIAREAERQCGRGTTLELSDVVSLADALAALGPECTLRLMPWEEAPQAPSLRRLLGPPSGADTSRGGVALLIGPEGGITQAEAELATGAGFRVTTLGPRILRTETAAIAALAVVQAALGALGPP
jgi:16S rRNA (uracil1498-N3)-methyltransferase